MLLNEKPLNFTICKNTKLEGPCLDQIGPPFYKPRSGPDRVGRFISSLALDRLPYRGHIFPDRGPIGAPPKFLHGKVNAKFDLVLRLISRGNPAMPFLNKDKKKFVEKEVEKN